MQKLDIVVQTANGLYLTLAECSSQANGERVGEAIYHHFKDAPPSSLQVRYAWLRSSTSYRDVSEPCDPHLLHAWPEASSDPEGWKASVAAWKTSPRAISGDESEPDAQSTRQAIEAELAKLPERYQPAELTSTEQRYTLSVDHGLVFQDKPAREAIKRAKDYVEEHESAGFTMPTGVVYGIYD